MIVFLDVNNRQILLYTGYGLKIVPFNDAYILGDYLKGEETIYYVTNAIEVYPVEIMELISTIIGKGENLISQEPFEQNKVFYLRSISLGSAIIPDVSLKFENKFDCKEVTPELTSLMEKSALVQKMLKKGTLEIIGKMKRTQLLLEHKQQLIKESEQLKKKDEVLDKIIIDKPIKQWDGTIVDNSEDDDISFDITDEVNAGENFSIS